MMVDNSSPEFAASVTAFTAPPPRNPLRTSYRSGALPEDQHDDDAPDAFATPQIGVKNLNTLEDLHDPAPEHAPPPIYEESDTSFGVDEHGTPHYVTVRTLSNTEARTREKQPHVWQIKGTTITLSALDATVLVKAGILEYRDLRLFKHTTNLNDQGPTDPLSGCISAVMGTVGTVMLRVADYPLIIGSVLSPPPGTKASSNIAEFACDAEKGVTGVIGATLKAPVDVTYNMARGFHNLPKLYGDRMVRRLDPITGARSGMRIAGKEFGLGCWDGVTGLVMQPIRGAQETGPLGCVKGVGKGIMGVALKPTAGAFGLTGYAGRGLYEQVQKGRKSKSNKRVREAQIKQGIVEWESVTDEQKSGILQRTKEDLETFGKVLGAVHLV